MKLIVRVQLVTDWCEVSEFDGAEIRRASGEFESKTLGLSLGDAKQIMHTEPENYFVSLRTALAS